MNMRDRKPGQQMRESKDQRWPGEHRGALGSRSWTLEGEEEEEIWRQFYLSHRFLLWRPTIQFKWGISVLIYKIKNPPLRFTQCRISCGYILDKCANIANVNLICSITFLFNFLKSSQSFIKLHQNKWVKDLDYVLYSWERRMELEESTCLTSDYTTKPQSSRQYGTGTKTEI